LSLILHSGLADQIKSIKAALKKEGNFIFNQYNADESDLQHAELLILGPESMDPVKITQEVHGKDKQITILILPDSRQFSAIKKTLQFTPFVGKNVQCIAYRDDLNFRELITHAAVRTRQRRSFLRISRSATGLKSADRRPIKLDQFDSFLEQAPIGALLLDPGTGRVCAFNSKATVLLDIAHLPKKAPELKDIFEPDAYSKLDEVINGRASSSIEIKLRNRVLEISASDVADEEGNPLKVLYIIDITHTRHEEQKIRTILEALPQMAWTADRSGSVTFLTQGWYLYTGQTPDLALGEGWQRAVYPDDLDTLLKKWREAIHTGGIYQHAARFRDGSGKARWYLIRGVPVLDARGTVSMWVGTCTDIHEHVVRTEELEQKVKARTLLLEETISELEQYARISSHDLQEPLRKINTFISIIRDKSYPTLGDDVKKYFDKISATANRMGQTLKDLLEYTRLGKEYGFTPVDLNDVAGKVTEDLELIIRDKQAIIEKEELPVIPAIDVQMTQLFYNLLSNALKFSRPDTRPLISIQSETLTEEELKEYRQLDPVKRYHRVRITDNGIGFDQQYAEQIFSVFKRLHSSSQYEGTGIGLAICKKIVANHSGIIKVTSKAGHGSSFSIILPAE